MATSVAEMAMARAGGGVRGKKRDSLSAAPVKPAGGVEKPERLDRTQGIQDSDYRLRTTLGASPVKARPAVALDVFDYEQLECVEFLASGAFSHVFSARYRGKAVVVKLLREQYKESHVTLKQMRFEQTLLSQLQHPNIVEFVGTGVYNGVPFTVLERLDETLNQRIAGEVKLTLLEALGYAKAIGEALVYLHEEALPGQVTLHRDLKPDNLAFSQRAGRAIKLIDFGLARSVPRGASIDEVYEMTGETGSLRYMAPEVALGMLYNAKADVYSLSLITWQMVQGSKPFQGMSRKDFFHHVVHRHFRPPVDAKWPPALSALILRSWDPDQLKRPTAREYVACVEEIMASLGHARHRRNSTGTSVSGGNGTASGLARVRSMFQAMKERAEDYVGGAGAATDGGDRDRRRSSVTAAEPQAAARRGSQAHQQQAPAAASGRRPQQQQQQQQAPLAPQSIQQPPSQQQLYVEGKEAAEGGAPDGGGQLQGEGRHERRNSY